LFYNNYQMSTGRPEDSPKQPDDAVSSAVHMLAMELHDGIVRDLHRSSDSTDPGFEERLAAHQRSYPHLLFGELAMYLADVQLPPDASAPDRARGIVEALRRISTTPSLFETITNAPYIQEFASGISPRSLERDENDDVEAVSLQQKIASAGYLERSMIPNGKVVQLQYRASPTIRTGRFSRNRLPEHAVITLKVVPEVISWQIKRYNSWNEESGYRKYRDSRTVTVPVFNLIAVNSSVETPPRLAELIGERIGVGQVSTGTQLRITHDFRRHTKEVPGHEMGMSFETSSLPAILAQAYLGDSSDYPLLSGRL
jgi:hypothetical protein